MKSNWFVVEQVVQEGSEELVTRLTGERYARKAISLARKTAKTAGENGIQEISIYPVGPDRESPDTTKDAIYIWKTGMEPTDAEQKTVGRRAGTPRVPRVPREPKAPREKKVREPKARKRREMTTPAEVDGEGEEFPAEAEVATV